MSQLFGAFRKAEYVRKLASLIWAVAKTVAHLELCRGRSEGSQRLRHYHFESDPGRR